jgi:glycosyltransferase involved in cell wall biosynthesis/SAM-dependent methyltransferase
VPTEERAVEPSSAPANPAQKRVLGVNIIGFFRAEFGQGEAARRIVAALERTGMPFSTVTFDRVPHRQDHPFEDREGDGGYPANIVCLNAEHLLQFVQQPEREMLRGRYSAGVWFWETSRLPRTLRPALDFIDEVWVASPFVAEAIAEETAKPVLTFPLPVLVPEPPPLTRADLGLSEDAFVFLFVFDFFSTLERKNPLGLIEAFKRAFPEPGRALLYLKSINGERSRGDLERLQTACEGRPDIVLSDGYVAHDRLTALSALCDCYVSLHRSEGFGLTIAEAMAFGKPAIATGYSGNLAFMDEDSGYLVPYSLTSLEQAVGPYPAGTVWADPDLDEAARLLRMVFDRPDEARERGLRGRNAVETRQSLERAASFLSERVPQLERLGIERASRQTPAGLASRFLADGPTVRWDAPSRAGRVGLLWRRVLLRLLRPYLVRQRELENLLVNGLEEVERSRDRLEDAVRTLQSLLEQVGGRLADVADVSDHLGHRLEDLTGRLYARPFVAETEAVEEGGAYAAFEDVFRGPEERVRALLEPYVELLREHPPVLDIGCGRGELLELLGEAGVEARGIDIDAGMVERARTKGLSVDEADALSHLEDQAAGGLGAIVAVQVIEHLSYEYLERLFEVSRRALAPGGLLVLETINPHSLPAFKTFWVDPTHRGPIFPEVAHALALIHGFGEARIVYPHGSGDAELDRVEQTEYALVATAPGGR